MKQPQIEDRLLARERPKTGSLLLMGWRQLLFLHWAWNPAEIQKTLPRGLFVDTFGGQAWLGIVPFFMRRVHPRGLPCLPWLSNFLELNVRTYVYNNSGRPGIWFYSLVCNQPVAVELAKRCFHLNYVHGRMHAQRRSKRNVYLPGETTSNAGGTVSLQDDIRSEDRNSTRDAGVLFSRTLLSLRRRSQEPALLWASSSPALPHRSCLGRKVEFPSRDGRRIFCSRAGP